MIFDGQVQEIYQMSRFIPVTITPSTLNTTTDFLPSNVAVLCRAAGFGLGAQCGKVQLCHQYGSVAWLVVPVSHTHSH